MGRSHLRCHSGGVHLVTHIISLAKQAHYFLSGYLQISPVRVLTWSVSLITVQLIDLLHKEK